MTLLRQAFGGRGTGYAILGLLAAVAVVVGVFVRPHSAAGQPAPQPASAAPADPALIARGKYLTDAADCQACHTVEGHAAFAGGRVIDTPFGRLISANITPGGIGDWTSDEFYRALHQGVDDEGKHLYPAFPYNYYTLLSRPDSDAIFAYLKTLPAVKYDPDRNHLPFPFNIRFFVTFWNWMFLHQGPFKPNPAKSAQWNRGAYLVEALGHCQACHTPQNVLGGPKTKEAFQGGTFSDWFAPDLSQNRRFGIGGWSRPELIEFLKTGRNVHASASAEMGDVVRYSTSRLTDADLNAIATYLTDRPATPDPKVSAPDPAVMRQGQAIFVDSCSACHRMDGRGVPQFFPPLVGDADLQQRDPMTTLHFILGGVQTTPTGSKPTPLSMPAYNWKLTDDQVAAVATFVRNSWGNAAAPASAHEVAKLRSKIPMMRGPAERQQPTAMTRPTPSTWSKADTDSRDNGTVNAGRAAAASAGTGLGKAGGQNGGSDKSHPAGVASAGPG